MTKKYPGVVHPFLAKILQSGKNTIFLAALGIAIFSATSFISLPIVLAQLSVAAFAGSTVYLSGVLYGIFNDIFAAKSNRLYYMLGHNRGQRNCIKSNKIGPIAVAWGIVATHGLSLIAGIIFTAAVFIAAFFTPIPVFIFPALLLTTPIIALCAHFYAKNKTESWSPEEVNTQFNSAMPHLDEYQQKGLDKLCQNTEDKRRWLSNSYRNLFGYLTLPLLGLAALITTFTISVPALFTLPLLTTILPVAIGSAAAVLAVASVTYLNLTHEKQDPSYPQLDYSEPFFPFPFSIQREFIPNPNTSDQTPSRGLRMFNPYEQQQEVLSEGISVLRARVS